MEALAANSDVSFTPRLRACSTTCYMITVARKAAAALYRADVPENCPVSESSLLLMHGGLQSMAKLAPELPPSLSF